MSEPTRPFFRPYILMLREGKGIRDDLMDYSLVILHVDANERLASPSPSTPQMARPMLQLPLMGGQQVLSANDPIF